MTEAIFYRTYVLISAYKALFRQKTTWERQSEKAQVAPPHMSIPDGRRARFSDESSSDSDKSYNLKRAVLLLSIFLT